MSSKSVIGNGLVAVMRGMLSLPGKRFHKRVSGIIARALLDEGTPVEEVILRVPAKGGEIRFYCIGSIPLWRAQTLLTKEPETIEWIDRFEKNEVFYDVGANIGVYTLYAAINRQTRVLAFEPAAANYFLLNRNIELNNVADKISAYCLAFNDQDAISEMHMRNTDFGSALSSFGEPIDDKGRGYTPQFKQGALGFSIDSFIETFKPPFPNHLKVDVDGLEGKIIEGARKTLANERLKSLSIELDDGRPDYTDSVVAQIEACGLV